MSNKSGDNLIDEGGQKVVFGTILVKVVEVSADLNSTLLFVDWDKVTDLGSVRDGVNEPYRM